MALTTTVEPRHRSVPRSLLTRTPGRDCGGWIFSSQQSPLRLRKVPLSRTALATRSTSTRASGPCTMEPRGFVPLERHHHTRSVSLTWLQEDGSPCSIFSFDIPANKSRLPLARNALKKLRTLRHPGVIKVLDTVEVGWMWLSFVWSSLTWLPRPTRTSTLRPSD